MDPYEVYGKPLITLERLQNAIRIIDEEFEDKLKASYTDDEIKEMTESLHSGIRERSDDDGFNAIALMLLMHRIDPEALERVLNTITNGVKHSYDAGMPMGRAIMCAVLSAFQIGWLTRGEKEELLTAENAIR